MFRVEADWISRIVYDPRDPKEFFPLLNVGSQTLKFRKTDQPHIDQLIFSPAREKNFKVVHTDLQQGEGIDISGDLCNPDFLDRLRTYRFKSVLCSNLLEHVSVGMRKPICVAIEQIVENQGYIIVTVPFSYPYHPDPIDTYFRPTPAELGALFEQCEHIESAIIEYHSFARKLANNRKLLFTTLIRSLMPFYRPNKWLGVVHQFFWLFRNYKVTAVLLRKRG